METEYRTKPLTITLDTQPRELITTPGSIGRHESLLWWIDQYWQVRVLGSPESTIRAKRDDLRLFLSFFASVVRTPYVDDWTPRVSKEFRRWLERPDGLRRNHNRYAPTSINRILATLRHLAKFIQQDRPFQAGYPFQGIRDLHVPVPEWDGLSRLEVMRLHAALDQVTTLMTGKKQAPMRTVAIFETFLSTALRASELTGLDYEQLRGKYLRHVRGKGDNYADVYLSADALRAIEQYVELERGTKPGPLFQTHSGRRMARQHVDWDQSAGHSQFRSIGGCQLRDGARR